MLDLIVWPSARVHVNVGDLEPGRPLPDEAGDVERNHHGNGQISQEKAFGTISATIGFRERVVDGSVELWSESVH